MNDEEQEQLKRLARRMTDGMLSTMSEGKEKETFANLRWLFEQGYVAGATDVLKASQDASVEIRTGFHRAQLQATIAAKLGY